MAKLELSLTLPSGTDAMKINLAHLQDELCTKFGLDPNSIHLEANDLGIQWSSAPDSLPMKIPASIGLTVYSSSECVEVMEETAELTAATILAFLKAELGIKESK